MANQSAQLTPAMVARMGVGRAKGSLNKTTRLAKQAIADAFEKLGGTDALVEWAKRDDDNMRVFYATIWPKIIPVQAELTGKDGGAIEFAQKVEDADAVASGISRLVAGMRSASMDGSVVH